MTFLPSGPYPPRRVALLALLTAAGLAPVGCRPPAAPPAAPPPPLVTASRPVSYPVQSYYEYNGYLEAIESVQVKARVKGFLDKVHFTEGDEIKAGDPLYTIDPREYEAAEARAKADIKKSEADMANARAQVQLAEAELGRIRRIGPAAAATEVDKAVATLAANKAQLDVAAANRDAGEAALRTARLDLEYTRIKSPIDGRISRTQVTAGNLVGQNESTLLTTIVSVDPLYVYFDVPERDLIEYQRSLRLDPASTPEVVPVAVGVATEEGYPHLGQIDFRENRVDTATGTVRIRGRVPNPKVPPGYARVLYPGLFARVRVPNGGPKPRLVLPEEALMTGQEGRFVYVVGKENVVQKRTITVGTRVWRAPPPGPNAPPGWVLNNPKPPANGGSAPAGPPGPPPSPAPTTVSARSVIAIDAGLEPGDLVIVNGLQKARPGAPVTPDVWDLKPPVQ